MVAATLRTVLILAALCVVADAFLGPRHPSVSASNPFMTKGWGAWRKGNDAEVQHIITRLTATRGGVAGNVSRLSVLCLM